MDQANVGGACKEKAIAEVISALSTKILADKGLLPGDHCC
jgi:hypothetical protein